MGTEVIARRGGVMVDSGTTYTYIISSEYKVLVSAIKVGIANVMKKHNVFFPSVSKIRVGTRALSHVGT